jgi:hypothetical protein
MNKGPELGKHLNSIIVAVVAVVPTTCERMSQSAREQRKDP